VKAKNREFCLPNLHATPPFKGPRWNTAITYGAQKTRMVWLPEGGKILKICLFVLAECTNVTDTRTDIQTDRHRVTAKAALA